MAENDKPDLGGKVDPSEDPGDNRQAAAHGQESGGGEDDAGVSEQKKGKPGESVKGINPVQHSE